MKHTLFAATASLLAVCSAALAQTQAPKAWEDKALAIPLARIVKLEFKNTDTDSIVRFFIQESQVTIVKDPKLSERMTLTAASAVTLGEAFQILEVSLRLRGFELIKQDSLLVIRKQAPRARDTRAPSTREFEIQVYKLAHAEATSVARLLTEVFKVDPPRVIPIRGRVRNPAPTPQGPPLLRASSEPYSNSVIVNTTPQKHREVQALLRQIDRNVQPKLLTRVYPLRYAEAAAVGRTIQSALFARTASIRGAAQNSVSSDARLNSLIVSATAEDHTIASHLIEALDQPVDLETTVFIIPVQNRGATEIADLLNQLFGDRSMSGRTRAVANPNGNSVLIVSAPEDRSIVDDILAKASEK